MRFGICTGKSGLPDAACALKVDAVRAVEAVQADIAFLAADRYVIAVGTQLYKRCNIVHRLAFERHQVILYRAGFGGDFLHQLIAQQVDFFNIGQRHEITFGILFVLQQLLYLGSTKQNDHFSKLHVFHHQ